MAYVWSFLIYSLILFVVSYILVEYGQKYLYDEVPPYVALKVGLGALIMAAILTWTKSSFETMFTFDLYKTVLLAMVWVGVFVLVYRFQPIHGAALALVAALLIPGLATIAVQGVTTKRPTSAAQLGPPKKAYRKPLGTTPSPIADAPAK